MTAMQKAMSAYGQAAETTPAGKQIVMLYDGILRQIANARSAITERRINDRYMAVQKATQILEALQGCLDFDKGEDIAPQLDRLYTHYIFRLHAINIEDDPAICDVLTAQIGELRNSWATINSSPTQPSAPVAPANPQSSSAAVTA